MVRPMPSSFANQIGGAPLRARSTWAAVRLLLKPFAADTARILSLGLIIEKVVKVFVLLGGGVPSRSSNSSMVGIRKEL